MKDILYNLALWHATNFCTSNGINCSGSHLVKAGRGFKYNLVRVSDGGLIVQIELHKHQVPTYAYYK